MFVSNRDIIFHTNNVIDVFKFIKYTLNHTVMGAKIEKPKVQLVTDLVINNDDVSSDNNVLRIEVK